MNKDITAWAKTCLACQRGDQQFQTPDGRFDSIHVDIAGPLPPSRGTWYVLTIIDRFTRWPEAIPMSDATALSCARALLGNWLPRFGVPTDITPYRGRLFALLYYVLWTELSKLLGTRLHCTTAHYPHANSLDERFHRHLKASLKARLHGQDWRDELPFVQLGIRFTIKEELGCTAAELVCGKALRLPGELFETTARTTDPTADVVQVQRESMRRLRAKPTT